MHDVSCGFSINVLYKVEVKSYSYSSPVLISILLLLFFECFYHGVGFPGSSVGKPSASNVGDLGLNRGLGRFPGGRHGNPFQYSCLENPHGQKSLVGYRPWGSKESDTTEIDSHM